MTTPPSVTGNAQTTPRSAAEIRDWLVNKLSDAQGVGPEEVRLDEPLISMGLDSMKFVVLVGELEQWLGCKFTDNPMVAHPTINAISNYLADQLGRGKKLIDPTKP
jgi:acyl carrier protein